jgi:hypothetical protein
METYLNPGQKKLNGCYNEECFKKCLENGWVVGCFCRHPDRYTKETCAECHGITLTSDEE